MSHSALFLEIIKQRINHQICPVRKFDMLIIYRNEYLYGGLHDVIILFFYMFLVYTKQQRLFGDDIEKQAN